MVSSVADARTIVLLERLLNDGAVVQSELWLGRYEVSIQFPDRGFVQGWGDTFPAAFTDAAGHLAQSC